MKNVDQFYNYLSTEKRYSINTIKSYKRDLTDFIKYLEEEKIGGIIESFGEKLGDWIVNDLKIEIDKLFKTLPDKKILA